MLRHRDSFSCFTSLTLIQLSYSNTGSRGQVHVSWAGFEHVFPVLVGWVTHELTLLNAVSWQQCTVQEDKSGEFRWQGTGSNTAHSREDLLFWPTFPINRIPELYIKIGHNRFSSIPSHHPQSSSHLLHAILCSWESATAEIKNKLISVINLTLFKYFPNQNWAWIIHSV